MFRRAIENNAHPLAAMKKRPSMARAGKVNLAGSPRERISASPEGPAWKLNNNIRYEAMKARCSASLSRWAGERLARRANIIISPKFCPV